MTPIRALEQEQCIYNINILHAFEEVVVNDGIHYQILQPFVPEPPLLETFLSDLNQNQNQNVIQKQNHNHNQNVNVNQIHNHNHNQNQKAECSCAVNSVSTAHSAKISYDLPTADLIVTRNEIVLDTFEYPLLLMIYSILLLSVVLTTREKKECVEFKIVAADKHSDNYSDISNTGETTASNQSILDNVSTQSILENTQYSEICKLKSNLLSLHISEY